MEEQAVKIIANEIYDNVAQVLSLVKMNLYELMEGSEDKQTKSRLQPMHQLLGQAITDLRHLGHTLDSGMLPGGSLKSALKAEAALMAAEKGIVCNVIARQDLLSLQPEQELLVYRIAHELLRVMAAYEPATAITIQLQSGMAGFCLSLSDNAFLTDRGAAPNAHPVQAAIAALRHHAAIIDAMLEIRTATPDSGNTISLTINPLDSFGS